LFSDAHLYLHEPRQMQCYLSIALDVLCICNSQIIYNRIGYVKSILESFLHFSLFWYWKELYKW